MTSIYSQPFISIFVILFVLDSYFILIFILFLVFTCDARDPIN